MSISSLILSLYIFSSFIKFNFICLFSLDFLSGSQGAGSQSHEFSVNLVFGSVRAVMLINMVLGIPSSSLAILRGLQGYTASLSWVKPGFCNHMQNHMQKVYLTAFRTLAHTQFYSHKSLFSVATDGPLTLSVYKPHMNHVIWNFVSLVLTLA